jgi:hypothetical protein
MSDKKKPVSNKSSDKEEFTEEIQAKIKIRKEVFKKTRPIEKEQIKSSGKLAKKEVSTPQRACIDCHFLAERRDETDNIDAALERDYKFFYHYVEIDTRGIIRETPSSFLYFKNLCCEERVWRCHNDEEKQHGKVIGEDRINCYLYYPYTEGMSFEAGKKMRDKEQSNKIESIVKSVAGTKVSKKPKAKKVSHKKDKLKRGEKQPNIPYEELIPFVKQDMEYLRSKKGLKGGALTKRIQENVYTRFAKKYGEKADYKISTIKNKISEINTGKI